MALLAKQQIKRADSEDSNKVRKPYQFLFDYGIVEIEAMTFIRGRSWPILFLLLMRPKI